MIEKTMVAEMRKGATGWLEMLEAKAAIVTDPAFATTLQNTIASVREMIEEMQRFEQSESN